MVSYVACVIFTDEGENSSESVFELQCASTAALPAIHLSLLSFALLICRWSLCSVFQQNEEYQQYTSK